MKKRIRLTIEWDGACGEQDWISSCSRLVEDGDISRCTKVVKTEALTDFGTTERVACPDRVSNRVHVAGLWKAKARANPWFPLWIRLFGRRVL